MEKKPTVLTFGAHSRETISEFMSWAVFRRYCGRTRLVSCIIVVNRLSGSRFQKRKIGRLRRARRGWWRPEEGKKKLPIKKKNRRALRSVRPGVRVQTILLSSSRSSKSREHFYTTKLCRCRKQSTRLDVCSKIIFEYPRPPFTWSTRSVLSDPPRPSWRAVQGPGGAYVPRVLGAWNPEKKPLIIGWTPGT